MSSMPSHFGEKEVRTLQLLAGLIGVAIGRSAEQKIRQHLMAELEKTNKRLEELSITDGLTGLSNRRHFDNVLRDAYAQEMRRKGTISLIMIDVDHFKQFNDTHGHPAGDEVLQTVAATLRKHVRAHEGVARFGGEEFAIILPGSDASAAIGLGKRLRIAVEDAAWPLRPVTISLGVATSTPNMDTPQTLLERADEALYHSKRDGRNRVTHHGDFSN